MISNLCVENYRAIRRLDLDLGPLVVVTGPNGAGKTTLYRALELIQAAAVGDLSARIAAEGGMGSAMWAGSPWRGEGERDRAARARGKGPAQIRLAAVLDGLSYELTLGLPRPTDAALGLDPVVKAERVRMVHGGRASVLAERKGPALSARGEDGRMALIAEGLWLFETALSTLADPTSHPAFDSLRRRFIAMRFYSQFRTDPESPLRRPQPAIMTPSMASDGADWAAALASTARIEQDGFAGSDAALAVAAAFPGGEIGFREAGGAISAELGTDAFHRAFDARELSDGTLRFLALTAALCPLRPPPFLALNEPEASLHPELIDPLADMIARAAGRSQILVATHSERLADRLEIEHAAQRVRLRKVRGETETA